MHLSTAPTTTDTTTHHTPTATPFGQGGDCDLEATAVILAWETFGTESTQADPIIHSPPTTTPIGQGGSSELEVNVAVIADQNVTIVPAGENPTVRQTPLATPMGQNGSDQLEVNVVELEYEHFSAIPGRAHPYVHRTDIDTILGHEEGRSELDINAVFAAAGEGGTGNNQAKTAEDDQEDKMMAGDVDPEDDGSGEYIDSPDDQADSDDHGDVEDAVGEVQVAEGTHVRQVLRLQGTRHTLPILPEREREFYSA